MLLEELDEVFGGHAAMAAWRAVRLEEFPVDPVGYRARINVQHLRYGERGEVFRQVSSFFT
jgi:hypothetical protein